MYISVSTDTPEGQTTTWRRSTKRSVTGWETSTTIFGTTFVSQSSCVHLSCYHVELINPLTSLIFPGQLLVMIGDMTADYVQAGNALTIRRTPKLRVVRNHAKIMKT